MLGGVVNESEVTEQDRQVPDVKNVSIHKGVIYRGYKGNGKYELTVEKEKMSINNKVLMLVRIIDPLVLCGSESRMMSVKENILYVVFRKGSWNEHNYELRDKDKNERDVVAEGT